MALIEMKIFSEALGMATEVCVVMPQRCSISAKGAENKDDIEKLKCLYLLHGLKAGYSDWARRTSIERYATDYGICVVMPNAHRSFYTDMKYGNKYYTYIAKELPMIIQEFFHVSEKRENTYIAGMSMGGYGALKIGLREQGRFSAAAGISTLADIHRKDFHTALKPVFGEDLYVPEEEDLFSLARLHSNDPVKPRIFMSCGTSDFMYQDNVRLKEKFQGLDYDYTYEQAPGGHTWEFWDEQIQHVLKWMFPDK